MSDQNFDPVGGGGPAIDVGLPTSDTFAETTSKSWFSRILNSIAAILFGLLIVIGSCVLLFWNEGRAAKTAAALAEGAGAVLSVAADRVDPANEGKLVHVAGDTSAAQPVSDSEFGIATPGLKLSRKVEMYQWKEESHSETQKKLGGGEETVTRYSYLREWSDRQIDSSRFRDVVNHRNPQMPNTPSRDFVAPGAKVGAFALGDHVAGQLPAREKFDAPDSAAGPARTRLGNRASVCQGGVYVGDRPDTPAVGDVRIEWTLLPLSPVSVVARQNQSTFSPWIAHNGNEVLLVETGVTDAALMFKHGQDENRILTWVLRLVGLLLMFVGFRMMLSLIEVLADVVPFFGNVMGAGASLVALLCTMVLAPVIVAIAWIFYRPLVAAVALLIGAGVVYGLRVLMKQRHAVRASAPAAVAPVGAATPLKWGAGAPK